MRVYRGAFGIIMAQGIVPNSFEVLKYLFLKLANKYAYFLPKSESHHACKRHLSKKNVHVFFKGNHVFQNRSDRLPNSFGQILSKSCLFQAWPFLVIFREMVADF